MAKSNIINNTKLHTRTITDFLNKEYLEYAFSVVEDRSIPGIDGFKPAARKIVHSALSGSVKDGKLYKLLALSGDTMKLALYAHGDASLNAGIVSLCKDFNDNLNPLQSDSQIGSLRDTKSCGAPRYLYVQHSKYMDLYKTDYDLLEFIDEEGQKVEPKVYYPIIPTVLCKSNIGVAVGYSMHNQAYNPIDVIDQCIIELYNKFNKKQKDRIQIRPYVRGIKQTNWRFENSNWLNYGEWSFVKSTDLMKVTDLPADVEYEGFEKLLNKFEESGYIKGWKNLSTNGNINYEIQFPKKFLTAQLKKSNGEQAIVNKFKLVKQLPEDLLWLLDENRKLKFFETRYDVIKYFVDWRLSIYVQRKKKLVKILEERYKINSELVKFIELVCKGKLKIRNRSKADIKIDMDSYKLPFNLVSTPMSKCTIEERDELLKQNEEIKKELEYIKNTSEQDMYLNDLKDLRKKLESDFK